MTFSWLHLTDLHLGMDEQSSLLPVLKDRFFEDLESVRDKCGPCDLVIFSGDLTQSGNAEEFQRVDEFLGQLWDRFQELGCRPSFLAVPGNHDLVRPNAMSSAVKALATWAGDLDVQSEFWTNPKSDYRTTVEAAFQHYQDWWAKAPRKPATTKAGMLPGDFSATFEKDGARIGIVGLNSTFLQLTGGDYTTKLALDARQFTAACDGDGPAWVKKHNACLLVTHQPPSWLTSGSLDELRGEIAGYGYFVAHLFGHMHEARYVSSAAGGASVCREFQGTSLFSLERYGPEKKADRRHGYAAGRIELQGDAGSYSLWPRKAYHPGGQWKFAADNDDFDLTDEHLKYESFKPWQTWRPPAPPAPPMPPVVPAGGPPPPPLAGTDSPFPKKWAILIGVNDYTKVPKLHYCRNDVVELGRTLRETLEFPAECVFEFHEESALKPERLQIFNKLGELRDSAQVGSDDLLIFYFSGHGMNSGNKDYLLPIEASARDVRNLGILVEDVVRSLQEIGCSNVALFIDACRELDTGAKGTASIGADSADAIGKAGMVCCFSCDPRDRSYEIDDLKHGSFSYCILEAVKQGSETVAEVDNYLKTVVPQVNTKFGKPAQQPYAVIQPTERGSLRVLYNRQRREAAARQFDPLMGLLLDMFGAGAIAEDDCNGALQFLDQLKDKAQPDPDDKIRLYLVKSLANGALPPRAFHSAWQMKQTVRGGAPQIQKKLPQLG